MVRKTLDDQHLEFTKILDDLLASDQDISAREVARRHSELSSPSTITRHPERRSLLESYQKRQGELRLWKNRLGKTSKDNVAERLAAQQSYILELENKVKILTTGHVALLAAVAQLGGMAKLAKFYEDFREVRNGLQIIGAVPEDFGMPAPLHVRKKRSSRTQLRPNLPADGQPFFEPYAAHVNFSSRPIADVQEK